MISLMQHVDVQLSAGCCVVVAAAVHAMSWAGRRPWPLPVQGPRCLAVSKQKVCSSSMQRFEPYIEDRLDACIPLLTHPFLSGTCAFEPHLQMLWTAGLFMCVVSCSHFCAQVLNLVLRVWHGLCLAYDPLTALHVKVIAAPKQLGMQ
jgi:hypothetical protein